MIKHFCDICEKPAMEAPEVERLRIPHRHGANGRELFVTVWFSRGNPNSRSDLCNKCRDDVVRNLLSHIKSQEPPHAP